MAETVTWERLRELASFRAENGCAISLYVDLDPSVTPTAGDAATRVNSLLDEAAKRAEATRDGMSHDVKQSLRADFDRLREFFARDFDRDGAHGFAVFCAGMDDLWEALPLTEPVPDVVKVGRQVYLAPLVPLVAQGEGALVAFVNRERGDVYRLVDGRLEELADHTEQQPGRHDQGGWSQARFQRHIDELASDHMRRVADEVNRRARRTRVPVVILCPEQVRGEFGGLLAQEATGMLAGWTHIEDHAPPAAVLDAVKPVLDEWRAKRESETLERWREEAGRGGRATAGWADTLAAASDGRVELLLYGERAAREAFECPSCGRASLEGGACPLDGTTMEARDDGLDLAVHRALSFGATVLRVEHHQDLDPVEGIGALLRF